jgi:predicted transcriptional regulator of viral defense system
MSHLADNIFSAAQTKPEGGLLSPKEFLHLGSRAAVDKTLSRLTQEGKLLRVSRGAYAAPRQGRFGSRPPSTESVVQAIEASYGETVVANGAAEANVLGLTTQVPTREVFLTSGTSRSYARKWCTGALQLA